MSCPLWARSRGEAKSAHLQSDRFGAPPLIVFILTHKPMFHTLFWLHTKRSEEHEDRTPTEV